MIENPVAHSYPSCGLVQEPILVVRSAASTVHGWTLRCHSCGSEWLYQRLGVGAVDR